jgi:hypothetical protein
MQETKIDNDAVSSVLGAQKELSGSQKDVGETAAPDQSTSFTELSADTIKGGRSAHIEGDSALATNEPAGLRGWRLVAVLFWCNIQHLKVVRAILSRFRAVVLI